VRRALALGAAVALVVLAACSGDDDSDAGSSKKEPKDAAPAAADAAAVPSDGCEGAATDQADLAETKLPIRGTERRYLLSAPAWGEGDDPLPLVVDFHGLAEGADVHANMTQMGPFGVEEGFVTVFPNALGSPVAWNVDPDPASNADLALVEALLDKVEAERCIDTSRVYATGLSNGAMMTSTVACVYADRFAAVAPVSGINLPDGCEPSKPVPIMTFHGTADPILMFNGGFNAAALGSALGGGDDGTTTTTVAADLNGEGYPDTVKRWAELDGCKADAHDEDVTEEVIRRTYDCPEDADVVFFIIKGGGHTWPSSEFSKSIEKIVGHTTFDVNADEEIWSFFTKYRRG
jgi:polyhydroxybutyrate depolymerase